MNNEASAFITHESLGINAEVHGPCVPGHYDQGLRENLRDIAHIVWEFRVGTNGEMLEQNAIGSPFISLLHSSPWGETSAKIKMKCMKNRPTSQSWPKLQVLTRLALISRWHAQVISNFNWVPSYLQCLPITHLLTYPVPKYPPNLGYLPILLFYSPTSPPTIYPTIYQLTNLPSTYTQVNISV